MIKDKLIQILSIVESESSNKPVLEISDSKIIDQIDEILGKNKFIYCRQPNIMNICLVYKRKNLYVVKPYWIKEFLNRKN